jgi:cysteinyl-tRNA synthetase
MSSITLHNTATRTLEEFTPPPPHIVTMYHCGPTVYNFAHIGNLRAFIFADIIRRTFTYHGYTVKQVMNITDVGHLVSDGDEGEDKMEKGARREGKSAQEIAQFYESAFHEDLSRLNILPAHHYPRATAHIPEQIALIQTLEEKGYTYRTTDGIYFDTARFPKYGKMARLDLSQQREGARVEMNTEKRNPSDFALWKFSPRDGRKREQEWPSPWGVGFPGWHLECSAMAMHYLGETIDIHTGGIDHIPVHHTNEIAQSECATGKPFARYWMHSAFMNVEGQKMSKSLENTYTLSDLAKKGISPLAFRYWLLTANYNAQINFTWSALEGAEHAYHKLREFASTLPDEPNVTLPEIEKDNILRSSGGNLHTSWMIAHLWDIVRSTELSPSEKRVTIAEFDTILGLKLLDPFPKDAIEVTPELQTLLNARANARASKDFSAADRIRDEIADLGYVVSDTSEGQKLSKK